MFGHGSRARAERLARAKPDRQLRAELVAMAQEEHAFIAAGRSGTASDAVYVPADDAAFRALSDRHAARIWELLDDLEMWPGRRLVDDEGEQAAWLIVMHAAHDLDLQRRACEHLELAVDLGDAPELHYAALADRIAMGEGRAQRYGTQCVVGPDGAPAPWPIEDPDGVDARRAALGLGSLADHLAALRADEANG